MASYRSINRENIRSAGFVISFRFHRHSFFLSLSLSLPLSFTLSLSLYHRLALLPVYCLGLHTQAHEAQMVGVGGGLGWGGGIRGGGGIEGVGVGVYCTGISV